MKEKMTPLLFYPLRLRPTVFCGTVCPGLNCAPRTTMPEGKIGFAIKSANSVLPSGVTEGGKEGRKALRGHTTKKIDDGGRWSEDFYGYVI